MITIEASPTPYGFSPDHTALLVIDMVRDLLEAEGVAGRLGWDLGRLGAVVPVVRRLVEACRRVGIPVVHCRESHAADLSDCLSAKRRHGALGHLIGERGTLGRFMIRGEPGSAFVAELAPRPGELVIDRPGKGGFYATDLATILVGRGISHLLVAGIPTEGAVQTTIREACDRGFACLLVEDATDSPIPGFRDASLHMIRTTGADLGWTARLPALLAGLAPVVRAAPAGGPAGHTA
jgi:nicotinamidase-related amidase